MGWIDGDDFASGGQALYEALANTKDDGSTTALIVEACRMKDRLDVLHRLNRGDVDTWTSLFTDNGEAVLKIDATVSEARQLATVFRQTLVEIQRRQGDGGGEVEDGFAGL